MAPTFLPEPAFAADDAQKLAKTDLTKCSLLLNIGSHLLSYAIFDPRDQYFISLKGYYFDLDTHGHPLIEFLEQFFDRDKILFTAFSQTKISFDTPEFTLIPLDLYDPALKREYLGLIHPEYGTQSLLIDQINAHKAVNLYAVDKNVSGYLKKEFRAARYYHTETAFLCALMKYEEQAGKRIYVRIMTDRITITVMDDGRLLMMQPYVISHGMDALYYVTNAMKRHQFRPEETRVFLSGEIEEDSPLYLELHYEIPSVSWLKHPAAFHYVPAFRDYPEHHFYNLLSLASCE